MLKLFWLLLVVTAVVTGEIHKDHIHANNELTIDIFRELTKENKGNFLFSTFSLESLLALTYLGAGGETATQLKTVLQFPESHEKLKESFKNVYTILEAVQGPKLLMANNIFLAKDVHPEENFTKTAEHVFKAGVENLDFSQNTKAAEDINAWVEKKTENKIKNLITPDQLSQLTKLVMANTLYFKGEFEVPFNPEDTKKMDFHKDNNETVQVDMMELTHHLPVYHNKDLGFTGIKIPYAATNGKVHLLLGYAHNHVSEIVGKAKKIAPEQRGKYKKEHVRIYLPKFKLESTIDFKHILKNMGITKLFSAPDLSGITKDAIEVSSIDQKVHMHINEHGSEAAAASAGIANARNLPLPGEPIEYHFNRPFVFTLMYDEIMLLTGNVADPHQKETIYQDD